MSEPLLWVAWPHSRAPESGEETLWRVMREALRLSVGRIGCVAVLCRVDAHHVCLIVRCRTAHSPEQLIEWVRAAARFAVTAYSGWAPSWDAPYQYRWVMPADLHHEIRSTLQAAPGSPCRDDVSTWDDG